MEFFQVKIVKDSDSFFVGVWLNFEFLVCKIVEIMKLIKLSCLYSAFFYSDTYFIYYFFAVL